MGSVTVTMSEYPSKETYQQSKDTDLTLQDLDNKNLSKKRIQAENVKHGMAFCANETKRKSIKKLRDYLLSQSLTQERKEEVLQKEKDKLVVNSSEFAFISIDSNTSLCYKYPAGKTRKYLMNILVNFFEDSV